MNNQTETRSETLAEAPGPSGGLPPLPTGWLTNMTTDPNGTPAELFFKEDMLEYAALAVKLAAQSPSQPLVEVQEPVMTIGFDESEKCRSLPFGMKLYAAPVRGLPLTEERIMECRVWSGDGIATRFDKIAFARQIEAAHGIGAAPPSGSGEGIS